MTEFTARYSSGVCEVCDGEIEAGETICYDEYGDLVHAACIEKERQGLPGPQPKTFQIKGLPEIEPGDNQDRGDWIA